MHSRLFIFILLLQSALFLSLFGDVFEASDVFKLKYARAVAISPDGKHVAYTIYRDRDVTDDAGPGYSELYVVSANDKSSQPFITGDVNVSSPQWSPDGKSIAFLMRRGEKGKTQVWVIPVDGGEASVLTKSESRVIYFHWHPDAQHIAYIAETPETAAEKKLRDQGYGFVFYEENLKHRNLYIQKIYGTNLRAEQLTKNITVWDFKFSNDGNKIAATASEKNLIDHRYMFRKIFIFDLKIKTMKQVTNNDGKIGNYAFSPDGSMIVYAAALERKDHQVSQVYVISASGDKERNLTERNFKGHVEWVGWIDKKTVLYRAGEGMRTTFSTIPATGGKRNVVLNSKDTGIIYGVPDLTPGCRFAAFTGSSPKIPSDVFYWKLGTKPERITGLNWWIEEKSLGKQDIIKYKSRDGADIEGILVYPVGYEEGSAYPLIVYVHGGPEAHYSQRWVTSYSTPGQVMAGKEYTVFYPNYRASTGYGVEFAAVGYEDPAGKEFDDIADGIEYLVTQGIADKNRVGIAGGSYGGYASAWFATYYTELVNAVCMFVGISDLISKRGTTDIAYEELYVHSGKLLEGMWDLSLKRSPIYWAHQSKTATLIYGGTSDTRVHPSQSLELYRRMKMNNHPAVRLVQYPGEGHGNRRQPARVDVLFRQIEWFDWYVKDNKPPSGPMPRLNISDRYGLNLDVIK
jgi:dipeptidyl aminopeptidase/acylaminoacyl peptidase